MKKQNYEIRIEVLTGLHIGIGSDKPEIGGIDNPFIKDPVSKLPYIPGSSLKGKLRSLLETESNYPENEIARIFEGNDKTPTRVLFRDVFLSKDYKDKFSSGMLQTEIKTEIKIDRKTGTATKHALRTSERVPPTTIFSGEVLLRFEDDDDKKQIKFLLEEAIRLLNNDYLGGSGSRGYGAVYVSLNEK